MKHDTWQRDFDALRAARPSRWGRLVNRRLRVAPAWCVWLLRTQVGGAMVCARWIVISPELEDAPPHVRRYLLAHEWGHVRRGHVAVAMAVQAVLGISFLLLLMSAAVSGLRCPITSAAGLVVAVAALAGFTWATREKREWEADAEAAAWIGAASALAGRDWMAAFVGGKGGRRRARRRAALEKLVNAERSAGAWAGARSGPDAVSPPGRRHPNG